MSRCALATRREVCPEDWRGFNAFIEVIWGLIPPEILVSIIDSIKDVMNQSFMTRYASPITVKGPILSAWPVSMGVLPDQLHEEE